MSEQYLSTMSKTFLHLKRFKFIHNIRRKWTQIFHQQGQKGAGAFLGSINTTQETTLW